MPQKCADLSKKEVPQIRKITEAGNDKNSVQHVSEAVRMRTRLFNRRIP